MKQLLLPIIFLSALFVSAENSVCHAELATESQLIGILQSSSSPSEKDAACAQLKRIGTVRCIPALAAFLTDEQLSHSARYALESMPFGEAGKALVQGLDKTSGLTEVGIINSLGVRRELAAEDRLRELLSNKDVMMACAAAEALGHIEDPQACKSLVRASAKSTGALHNAEIDGILMCANRLLSAGNEAAASKNFQLLCENQQAEGIREAAFRGVILSSGPQGVGLMADAIEGTDIAKRKAALHLAARIDGTNATQALAELLPKVNPPLQISLLQCLGQRNDALATAAVARLVDSPDPDVRLAAIKILGGLGDGSVVLSLVQKAGSSDIAERNAARQALLDLHRGPVTQAMLKLLVSAPAEARLEIIRALGDRGDTTAVPGLLDLARGENKDPRKASLQALAQLADTAQVPALVELVAQAKGPEAREDAANTLNYVFDRAASRDAKLNLDAFLKALETGSIETKEALFPVCSGLTGEPVRAIVRAGLGDSDARLREAAVRALCDTRDGELLPDLLKVACDTNINTFQLLALRGFVRLTTQEDDVNLPLNKKIDGFRAILGTTLDDPEKRLVLSGVGKIADLDALALAIPMLDEPAVKPEAAQAVLQIALAISLSHPKEAAAALKRVLTESTNEAVRKSARTGLNDIEKISTYITAWQVAGPYQQPGKDFWALFDVPFPPENTNPTGINWQTVPAVVGPAKSRKLDLFAALGGEERVAYARTMIYSSEDQPARLEIGSGGGIKVWLNDKLVHANNTARRLTAEPDKVNVTLKKGWNPLLIKSTQSTAGWEFYARFVKTDGTILPDLRASTSPDRAL